VILAGTYADSLLVGVAAFSVGDSFFSAVMLCYYSKSAACTELSLLIIALLLLLWVSIAVYTVCVQLCYSLLTPAPCGLESDVK